MSLATSNTAAAAATTKHNSTGSSDVKKDKPKQVRDTNISAAKALGDAIRTSLGPRGMDKMIIGANKGVTISNDGATILKEMQVMHPVAKMLVDLSKAQDIEAGDGTTSVVVLACSLLDAASKLLTKGIHPTAISEGFQVACDKAIEVVKTIATYVDLEDREALVKSAATSLSSKVVSQYSDVLSQISVDAVLALIPDKKSTSITSVDLNDIKIVKKLGGTIEDTELVTDGIVLTQNFSNKLESGSSSVKLENTKVGLIQFCISPPKTDMDSSVIVTDYTQMDRVLREERQYILKICKEIQKSGCNVLLIQKSILRDAITDVGIHFLSKMNIHVIKNIERDQVDYICKTVGCKPASSVDQFNSSSLATVKLVEEISTGAERYVKMTGVKSQFQSASIIIRGSNNLVIEEADRSLHDALCVVRSIVKGRHLIVGGGAAETEISLALESYSKQLVGADSLCVKHFGEAMDVIPSTLAENAGYNSVKIITELKKAHLNGTRTAGIDIKRGSVKDMATEDVVQPLLVTTSALTLATETVRCILKIDDMLQVVR